MKLWKSLFITSLALSSMNVAAIESGEHASQGAKYSALGASNGGQALVEVAATAVAIPMTIVGLPVGLSVINAGFSEAGLISAASGIGVVGSVNEVSPFVIGEEIIIGSSN
ncbi:MULTISPECIES: hypothetical protein [unclassified Agarivorans]|uniref:hypothetical protein n=1 Tax=unclassified Agarivorans TaxID=2636026 RepID=UPI0026E12908|nr:MULTISPECIES: hypothetical protein [unclassified Agarivorans]MDO6686501.1 hypothetical protein [Agarivorans sp. 3_MG-2023]MDO6715319.1 hypothetical protein [Agarivorans sp. 2_MG-2023]